jgi:hypothetical protein
MEIIQVFQYQMYISDRYVCLTYWRFQLTRFSEKWKLWKVTKSHVLLAKMSTSYHINIGALKYMVKLEGWPYG